MYIGSSIGNFSPEEARTILRRLSSQLRAGNALLLGTDSVGAGLLLRALEPLDGIKLMQRHRKTDKLTDLARGPGRLAAALQIDQRRNGVDLCADGPLWLGTPVQKAVHIGASVRIGITSEVGRLLRFFEVGNPFVSGPKGLSSSAGFVKKAGLRKEGKEMMAPGATFSFSIPRRAEAGHRPCSRHLDAGRDGVHGSKEPLDELPGQQRCTRLEVAVLELKGDSSLI
jgi:DNA-3-methyladenine glycosylase